jgi:predicted amidohydrolase
MQVYLSRWVCLDVKSNLRRLREECSDAAASGASLIVFPEAFLHGYTRTVEPADARALFGRISREHAHAAFVFGSFSERRRNRLTVWRGGDEVAHYDKVHLFEPNDEAVLWRPGSRYSAVVIGEWTLGLLTCNDVRFPEQARALRLQARCDALVVVAWWPWRREHVWRTLLRARAIENGVWVIGCCVAASQHPGEIFAGAGNHVFDPRGEPVATGDDRSYVLERGSAERLLVDPVAGYRDIKNVEVFGRRPRRPTHPARSRRCAES